MSFKSLNRRDFLKFTMGGATLATFLPTQAFAALTQKNNKVLSFKNLHTGERLETCFFSDNQFIVSELNKINHICRDFRRNEVHEIDKELLTQVNAIQTLLRSDAEVQIISGYRSPATNEQLRSSSGGVAKKSFHMLGKALDFRLKGVPLDEVRDVAISLKAGGVGYYPKSNFIHIDTGRARSWG